MIVHVDDQAVSSTATEGIRQTVAAQVDGLLWQVDDGSEAEADGRKPE